MNLARSIFAALGTRKPDGLGAGLGKDLPNFEINIWVVRQGCVRKKKPLWNVDLGAEKGNVNKCCVTWGEVQRTKFPVGNIEAVSHQQRLQLRTPAVNVRAIPQWVFRVSVDAEYSTRGGEGR